MAFCGYCGAEMPDDMSFCTECGKPLTRGKRVVNVPANDPNSVMVGTNDIPSVDNSYHEQNDVPEASNSSSLSDEKSTVEADPAATEDMTDPLNNFSYDRWTMSEGNDLISSDNLYDSLKSTNERKNKTEKRKFILPLILTLVFAAIAIVVLIIKFKPFDNLLGGSIETADSEITEDKPTSGLASTVTTQSTNSSSSSNSQSSSSVNTQNESEKEPRIVGSGGCVQPPNQFSDYYYMDYYYDVYNPNTYLIVQSPKVTTTFRSASGAIIATDSVDVGLIMPGDTVRIFGVIGVLKSELDLYDSEDCTIEWRDISKESGFHNPIRSDELVFSNVSARGASYDATVTGELTNNSKYDIPLSEIYAVFLKDGEIVMISDGFSDGVPAGATRVFEIHTFENLPEYDTIECYINAW